MNLLRAAGYLKIGLVGVSATPGEPARGAAETNSSEARPPETKP